MKNINLILKKTFLNVFCTGMMGIISVTAWAQKPTVTVPNDCIVVVPGDGGSVGPGGEVGDGGIVTMPDPYNILNAGDFIIDDHGTTLQTWRLWGDLSFTSSGTIDQSATATTAALPIYSFNKNVRGSSEGTTPSLPSLARSKGRVYIYYAATPCGGRIEFDIYKTYSNTSGVEEEYVPPIIGPSCWLPDVIYTYSVDQIASDNLGDAIGLDMYYWIVKDDLGAIIYDSQEDPSSYPDHYTSADKSSITVKAPSVLNSPYTIECCYGRANQWDGNAATPPARTTCVELTVGDQPQQPMVDIPECVSVGASDFTVSIVSPDPDYTYTWTTTNSAWTPASVEGTSATFGTLGYGQGKVILKIDGCSQSEFEYIIGRTLEESITSITGNTTCLSPGTDETFQISNASQLDITWILPLDWTINPGSPTNGNQSIISLHIPNTATPGPYTLQAWSCDHNELISKTVYVRPGNPVISSPADENKCIPKGDNTPLTFTADPAGSYQWQIPTNWTIVGTSNTESITVTPDGIHTGTVTATGIDAGGCTSDLGAVWTVNFNGIQPNSVSTTCWSLGIETDIVLTVDNAPTSPFYGTYTIEPNPALFSSYSVNPTTGAITLHKLASASGSYNLVITHTLPVSACNSLPNTIPVNVVGNGIFLSPSDLTEGYEECDQYRVQGRPLNSTIKWYVNGSQVFHDGNSINIINSDTRLNLCGSEVTPPTSVCVLVTTTGGCATQLCYDPNDVGTHGTSMIIHPENNSNTLIERDNDVLNNVTVYPNPNNGTFTISVPAYKSKATLKVYDINGKLVDSQELKSGSNAIKEHLSTGTYIVKVTIDGKTSEQKIQIEK